jgi:molybdenum cofactor cytidylyltransferase
MTDPVHSAGFSLGVVILAAGRSRRMGRPKLLLPWGETSVLGHLLGQWRAQAAAQIAVVRAADDQDVRTELVRLGFPEADHIENLAPERGMFSSIQCAAQWRGWRSALSHWAIVLGDQPHLRAGTLRAVCEFSAAQPGKVCQPARNGRRCHPVLLPKFAFLGLAKSNVPDLKTFLSSFQVAVCDLEDPGLDLDIDRPEDYEKALALAAENLTRANL